MNYLQQIVNFENWLEVNNLSTNAQTLWHRLMGLFNKTGFKKKIKVTNQRLMDKTGIGREPTFIRARNDLIEAGLLLYKKGAKGIPGTYEMRFDKFYNWSKSETANKKAAESEVETEAETEVETVVQSEVQTEAQSEVQSEVQTEVETEVQTVDIYKQEKTSQDKSNQNTLCSDLTQQAESKSDSDLELDVNESDYEKLLDSFSFNIRKPTSSDKFILTNLLKEYDFSTIACAIDRSKNSAHSANYIKAIIDTYSNSQGGYKNIPVNNNNYDYQSTYDLDAYEAQDDLSLLLEQEKIY